MACRALFTLAAEAALTRLARGLRGISFNCVGEPRNAPRNAARTRCSVSSGLYCSEFFSAMTSLLGKRGLLPEKSRLFEPMYTVCLLVDALTLSLMAAGGHGLPKDGDRATLYCSSFPIEVWISDFHPYPERVAKAAGRGHQHHFCVSWNDSDQRDQPPASGRNPIGNCGASVSQVLRRTPTLAHQHIWQRQETLASDFSICMDG